MQLLSCANLFIIIFRIPYPLLELYFCRGPICINTWQLSAWQYHRFKSTSFKLRM